MAIQYPDRIQALCMACATTGQLEHGMIKMFEDNEGRGAYSSPSMARMGFNFMPKFAKGIISADLMTANTIKKGSITEQEAEEIATKRLVDPYCAGVIGALDTFATFGAIYPESWDTMLLDMQYYKTTIPFDQVKVPVFMIHGECDADISYSQAEQAVKGIEGAILITQPRGTHSC